KTSAVLKDIWSINWNDIPNNHIFFKARVIPLNKQHPNIPAPDKFRPIIVSSPIVKLMESRILEKLQKYMNEKLYKGQTGFVKGMGTQVNLYRLQERINKIVSKSSRCY